MAERPTAVTVISVIYWIFCGIGALAGLMILFGGSLFAGMLKDVIPLPVGVIAGLGAIIGGVILIIEIFMAWVTYQFYLLKNWARIVLTVFCAIGLLSFPIGTIMNGIFLYLFWGYKPVRDAFK